ncbi:MAG: hypothetical protein ACRCTI_10535 [Beijerinckiaceae bacterium]
MGVEATDPHLPGIDKAIRDARTDLGLPQPVSVDGPLHIEVPADVHSAAPASSEAGDKRKEEGESGLSTALDITANAADVVELASMACRAGARALQPAYRTGGKDAVNAFSTGSEAAADAFATGDGCVEGADALSLASDAAEGAAGLLDAASGIFDIFS